MNRDTVLQYLHNTLQADGSIRAEAENAIKSFIQSNFQGSLGLFVQIIMDMSIPQQSRQMCSIIVKNCLHSKNQRLQKGYETKWLGCDEGFRMKFIGMLIENLDYKETSILMNLSKICGSIVRIEISGPARLNFFPKLYNYISNQKLAVGILDAVSFACDQLYEETTHEFSEECQVIFNTVMYYLNAETNPSRDILYSALRAILSSLEIFDQILDKESARQEFIYKIITCVKPDSEVLDISLEVLNRFVDIFRGMTDGEISGICQFYLTFFDGQRLEIPLQLFDFWTLLIDHERYDVLKHFIPTLVPNLLLCITKEDPEDLSPSPHKSSCELLAAFTSKMKLLLLSDQMYQNFILNGLGSGDLEKHAVAATALGCICTPGSNDFLYQVLPVLIDDLAQDVCVNEALFAIAKICEKEISLAVNFLPTIIQKTGTLVNSKAKVAVNAVMVYNAILSSMKADLVKEVEKIVLFHYSDILTILIYRLDQAEPLEYELRAALSLTLSELITSCPPSSKALLDQLQGYFVSKIRLVMDVISRATDQQSQLLYDDVMCGYVILLESCLSMRKIFDVDEVSELLIGCLNLPRMLLHGEIYIVISKLLNAFSTRLKEFIPYILRDVNNFEPFILKAALNLLSDCAILLESNFSEFMSQTVPTLANAITSAEVPLDIKPRIITTLGDTALAVGSGFEPYLPLCVLLLSQINTLPREGDEDYVDSLRKAVLQLFSCLFVSVGKTSEMRASFREILGHIRTTIQADKDGAYITESVNIINDIRSAFGRDDIDNEWMVAFLHRVIRGETGQVNKKATEILEGFY